MNILGEEIKRGKKHLLELEVAKLHTGNSIHVPIVIQRSVNDGPVVLLLAGVHGDEINGVAIVRQIIENKQNIPVKGTIIAIPVFNVFGYLMLTREFPDGRDLNRMFPGSKTGSLASQFAYALSTEILPHVDIVLDFHTGGADRYNVPQIRCDFANEKSLELAKVFGAPFVIHSSHIKKSLREHLYKNKIISLLFEGGKSNTISKEVVECGVKGINNVLSHLEMVNRVLQENDSKTIMVSESKWLRAPNSGMFFPSIKDGGFVKTKQVIGFVGDAYAEFKKKVKAPHEGYVICVNTSPIVNKGDAIFHISTQYTEKE